MDPIWAIKLQRTFLQILVTIKFTKTMLLIRLIPTFVVTVLTTIFVSDFSLLTKILTDFVHLLPQPPPTDPLLGPLWHPTKNTPRRFSHKKSSTRPLQASQSSLFRTTKQCSSLNSKNFLPASNPQFHPIGAARNLSKIEKTLFLLFYSPPGLCWIGAISYRRRNQSSQAIQVQGKLISAWITAINVVRRGADGRQTVLLYVMIAHKRFRQPLRYSRLNLSRIL